MAISGDGIAEDEHFMVMAGMGFDAAIMEGANEQIKAKVGWLAYVVSGLKNLMFPAVRIEISVDDGPWTKHRARTVVIGNVGYLQAGIPLLPDATIDDGILDVVILHPRRFLSWIPLAVRVLSKHKRTDETINRMTGRTVSVRAAHDTPRQLDGDSIGAGKELHAECCTASCWCASPADPGGRIAHAYARDTDVARRRVPTAQVCDWARAGRLRRGQHEHRDLPVGARGVVVVVRPGPVHHPPQPRPLLAVGLARRDRGARGPCSRPRPSPAERRFSTHTGSFGAPQFDPATRQVPSCGTHSSGVVRGSPDLRPRTVRNELRQARERQQAEPTPGEAVDRLVEPDDLRQEARHPRLPADQDRDRVIGFMAEA